MQQDVCGQADERDGLQSGDQCDLQLQFGGGKRSIKRFEWQRAYELCVYAEHESHAGADQAGKHCA